MAEIHDFDDTVVAILNRDHVADDVADSLSAAGYHFEVLAGEEGKQHLDPAGEEGPVATVKRLVNAFGDQYRVLDRLYSELDRGNLVISVDSDPDEATDAVRILQDHDADFIWKFGTWTYTRVGD